jgi:nicotinamidase/pyrazinamidase
LKKEIILNKKDALIVVHVQNCFLPGAALPVPEGNQIIPVLNEYITIFKNAGLKIFATRDWHPPNHISFKEQGGPWPPHCIQNSDDAKFAQSLRLPNGTHIISSATDPEREAYSGFDGTDLAEQLKNAQVSRVFVGGLATDYCVRATVLDGLEAGFNVVLLIDAIRGIDVEPGDVETAIRDMIKGGAEQAVLEDFPEPIATLTPEIGAERIADDPLTRAEIKKKTRMRSRGPYRKVRSER